jgi:3-carboxy-cis,cis-muconate cycloisomerase
VATALAEFADRHRATPMAGRTLLQQALPVSFGLVAANWLESVLDARAALARHDLPWLQFGGATGTLAALGDKALVVAQKLARTPPFAGGNGGFPRPWHTNRTRVIRLAGDLGLAVAALGKIARDVTLLMQTEVAELVEPEALGKGGSSTLPHKRNPVQSLAILAAAARAPGLVATLLHASVQEHQRGTGGWHAEWETLRDLLLVAGAATFHAEAMLAGLDVKAGRMRANLEATGGLIMAERLAFALSPGLGKTRAKQVMEAACRRAVDEGRHLREVLAATPECLGLDLEALLDPSTYLGAGEALIDRILDSHRRAIPPANGDKS